MSFITSSQHCFGAKKKKSYKKGAQILMTSHDGLAPGHSSTLTLRHEIGHIKCYRFIAHFSELLKLLKRGEAENDKGGGVDPYISFQSHQSSNPICQA